MVLGASLLILRCSSQTGTKRSSLNWHFASNRDNIAASQQASRCKKSILAIPRGQSHVLSVTGRTKSWGMGHGVWRPHTVDTMRVYTCLTLGNLTCLCGLGRHMLLSLCVVLGPKVVHRVGSIGDVSTAVSLN